MEEPIPEKVVKRPRKPPRQKWARQRKTVVKNGFFLRTWLTSGSLTEIATKLRISVSMCRYLYKKFTKAGVPIPKRPVGKRSPSTLNRRIDVGRMKGIIERVEQSGKLRKTPAELRSIADEVMKAAKHLEDETRVQKPPEPTEEHPQVKVAESEVLHEEGTESL